MKAKRFISMILLLAVWLCAAVQQGQAQQPASTSSKTDGSVETISKINPSTLLAQMLRGKQTGFGLRPSSRHLNGNIFNITPAPPQAPAVLGSGTVGKISMWTGNSPSGNSILGDSIITQTGGNIGIGTNAPMSMLTVQGIIETTLGGYKFPDGTVQTTAGLTSIFHDSTLTGNGTASSPLGVRVPLTLFGISNSPGQILTVINDRGSATGILAIGGGDGNGFGGVGVSSLGGPGGALAGSGLHAEGGGSSIGLGGDGVRARGGSSGGEGGKGVSAFGGQNSSSGMGGDGVEATGGLSISGPGGSGVDAKGGASERGSGGVGVEARGGDTQNLGFPGGDGVVATGGYPRGRGVVATGARVDAAGGGGTFASVGVFAAGGAVSDALRTGGVGVVAIGGAASGPDTLSGHGIIATFGPASDGADAGAAGLFQGRVVVGGDLAVSGDLTVTHGTKNFKIDHPLDPENKYLLHASVESSEVLNIYSGNIITNAKGEAVVTLPDWFEALNRDLRYQLTVIGTFAQAIVAEKVKQNRFKIRTSAPNVEVSWQVTGVRSDRAMQKHPFRAEEDKPERERGTYINPEAFDLPEERGVEWARHPELMNQLKQQRLEAKNTQRQLKPTGR